MATKALHTEAAIAATAHLFEVACSIQNGIGSEELLARHVPRVIRGVTMVAGHVVAPGEVALDADGRTWMGPFEHLTQDAWTGASRAFPGLVLEAFVANGTAEVTASRALITAAVYAVLAGAVAAFVFARRDVTA